MTEIRLETARWPVIIVTPLEHFTDREIDDFLERYAAIIKKRLEPYAPVLDLRLCKDMSPTERKRITAGMDGNREVSERFQRGVAMVFDSPVLRMLLTAILWARRPEYEIKVFTNLDEAVSWANRQVTSQASMTTGSTRSGRTTQ